MSQRDLLNVSSATWQWLDPLKSLFLIIIIALWGYFLEKCGEQPNDALELQQLMGLGSFIVTIAFSILIESTFINTTSFNWIQAPTTITKELNSSMFNAFIPDNFLISSYNYAQFNSLSSWVEKTKTDITEIAFMPFTIAQKQGQNLTRNNQSQTSSNNDNLNKWIQMRIYNNVGMQYLTSQCSAANLHCDLNSQEYVYVMAGKENQTISWCLCNLPTNTSIQIDCNITIKGGLFPKITLEYPSYIQQPREEDLSQVLARKNELSDLKEIKNNLFTLMEKARSRPFLDSDLITVNVATQLASAWSCEPGNFICAQHSGAVATIRYVGALLETASFLYFADNYDNITEWMVKNSSTGLLKVSHRVCLGGNNPMHFIGLMIAIPLTLVIIGLLPILYNDKLWWLAADIGNNYIALIRSINPFYESWKTKFVRPGENQPNNMILSKFGDKDSSIGLFPIIQDEVPIINADQID
ncbi:8348_t:CDS:2 [Gigaspora margarita]|uniref:8348_t:CDS:1 n=1 Tax=Gigaspora margarita TaxID=4874 RepID=A0ABN7V4E3_GIGMA|nr:8348_t:CDS:2 [Gigaspora margarita]